MPISNEKRTPPLLNLDCGGDDFKFYADMSKELENAPQSSPILPSSAPGPPLAPATRTPRTVYVTVAWTWRDKLTIYYLRYWLAQTALILGALIVYCSRRLVKGQELPLWLVDGTMTYDLLLIPSNLLIYLALRLYIPKLIANANANAARPTPTIQQNPEITPEYQTLIAYSQVLALCALLFGPPICFSVIANIPPFTWPIARALVGYAWVVALRSAAQRWARGIGGIWDLASKFGKRSLLS